MNDTNAFQRLEVIQLAPALFDLLLNLAWAILSVHRGKIGEHGSLASFIDVLEKKRHGDQRPDYHSLKATLEQVLCGLTLYAFELVLKKHGHASIEAFVRDCKQTVTAEQMLEYAGEIIADFATASESAFRSDAFNDSTEHVGRRNTSLLYRDILFFYTIFKAVKYGDFGRVEMLVGQATI